MTFETVIWKVELLSNCVYNILSILALKQNISGPSINQMLPEFRVENGEDAKLADAPWFVQLVDYRYNSVCDLNTLIQNYLFFRDAEELRFQKSLC